MTSGQVPTSAPTMQVTTGAFHNATDDLKDLAIDLYDEVFNRDGDLDTVANQLTTIINRADALRLVVLAHVETVRNYL